MEFYTEAHQAGSGKMTDAEQDDIWNWMQTKAAPPLAHRKTNGG